MTAEIDCCTSLELWSVDARRLEDTTAQLRPGLTLKEVACELAKK
jgi:hypothetical protein